MDLPDLPAAVLVTATLSARDGAGLYLVRRARTLTAPHQLRLLLTAFIALLVVDLGRIHLGHLLAGDPISWFAAGSELLSYLAMALVLWRVRAALLTGGLALTAALLSGGTGTEPLLLGILGLAAGAVGTPRDRLGFITGVTGYVVAAIALFSEHVGFILIWFAGAALVGLSIGTAVRALRGRLEQDGRQLAEVATEDARLRADERRLLARELHDVVTHQLANVSLQVMSHLDSTDPEQLRRALKRIRRSSDSALTELRLLVRVLRDDPSTAAGADEVSELSRRLAPTVAAAGWARRLQDAGFDPTIEIPARADRLETTVQGTITRTLDVACENIVRHAPERTRCTISLSVNPTQVVLRTASPLPRSGTPATVLGWGLRGLRERVDLTGGVFSAGPTTTPEPEWVVVVTLPHD